MGILDVEKIENKPSVSEVWNGIKNINKQTFENLVAGFSSAFNAMWNNQFYSAKEIFAEAGADALPLVMTSDALQKFLVSVSPEYKRLIPNCPIQVSEKGEVIVGEPYPKPVAEPEIIVEPVVEAILPQEPVVVTLPEEPITPEEPMP